MTNTGIGPTAFAVVPAADFKAYGYVVRSNSLIATTTKSTEMQKYFHRHLWDLSSWVLAHIPWNMPKYHSTQVRRKQNSSLLALGQLKWSSMVRSLGLLSIFVISWIAQEAAALNGSTRSEGEVAADGTNELRSNSVSEAVYYKGAQSAASVSNIVNGHYQSADEEDGSPPISVMSDSTGRHHYPSPIDVVDGGEEGYHDEVMAIMGGVLGFWGGIGGLGTIFLVVVMSKRYCCREEDDKEIDKDG